MTKKPLTILQVLPALNKGGVERGTVDVALFLQKKGHTPIIASQGGSYLDFLKRSKAQHITLPLASKNPLTILMNVHRLMRCIKKNQVDLVHARSRAPAWSAYRAARFMKVPFITTFHGTYNYKGRLKKAYNAVMTYGQKIIAPSKFIQRHVMENYGVDKEKIKVIPRGVDLDTFTPEKVDQGRLKRVIETYGLPLDKKIILLPGRFSRWKGHQVLLDALVPLRERGDFFCLMLGDTPEKSKKYRAQLERFIQKEGLEEKMALMESADDMAALYKLAHVVVSPSTDPEAFGRVMAEAGAMGTPVIASNHGGATEIIQHGKTGWLFESGDAKTLSRRLEESLDMGPEDYEAISSAAEARIGKYFSNTQMFSKTLKVYESLL